MNVSRSAVAAVVVAGVLGIGGGAWVVGHDGDPQESAVAPSGAGTSSPSTGSSTGSSSTPPSSPPTTASSTASSTASTDPSTVPSDDPSPVPQPSRASLRECTDADLTASFRATDAGAGNRYGKLILTNTGTSACRTRGFGGLSYVGGGDGTQVGAPADRDGKRGRWVTLQVGERAASEVDETVAENYPVKACDPTPVDGFRVYVPDSTAAQFVEHATTGCADDDVHLISHRTLRPFRGLTE